MTEIQSPGSESLNPEPCIPIIAATDIAPTLQPPAEARPPALSTLSWEALETSRSLNQVLAPLATHDGLGTRLNLGSCTIEVLLHG